MSVFGQERSLQSANGERRKSRARARESRVGIAMRNGSEAMMLALAVNRVARQIEAEEQHGKPLQLVKDGRWNVPLAERPNGWERWGLPEA